MSGRFGPSSDNGTICNTKGYGISIRSFWMYIYKWFLAGFGERETFAHKGFLRRISHVNMAWLDSIVYTFIYLCSFYPFLLKGFLPVYLYYNS